MRYCAKCLYPENAKPTIIIDEDGICSGCRYHESRMALKIDWDERWHMLVSLCEQAKSDARQRGNKYDCIIPVSGGKDSHYQVWLLTRKLGMKPLLVHFNHAYNTVVGKKNLRNLVEKSGCDLEECNYPLESACKLSRLMLEKVGDLTWHYHAGIKTYPIQVAVEKNIPLIVWGEHGFAELTGIVSLHNFVEFTRWSRKEHDMRGIEPEVLLGENGITENDIKPFVYPDDNQIEQCDLVGIYLSNFIYWDANKQAEEMINEWEFNTLNSKRGRTFNLFSKIEDHANEVHDYLKYLKFGYGRTTDDASYEIRHGRLTRSQGIALVKEYDGNEPKSLDMYCGFMGISKEDFYEMINPLRDDSAWVCDDGEWVLKDPIFEKEPFSNPYTDTAADNSSNAMSKQQAKLYWNSFSKSDENSNLGDFYNE